MDDVIWIVRHGEREDVAHLHSWISRDEDSKYQHLPDDDPPLSTRGRQQSTEVGHYLRNMSIAHIFSSPFDRCVETASLIVAEFDNRSTVNIESNIGDVLYDYPPGKE
jgi:broad specificity phosphatase PhoE